MTQKKEQTTTESEEKKSFFEKYKIIKNEDGTADIILPKPTKMSGLGTIRLYTHQIEFMDEFYRSDYLSGSIRLMIDDLMKFKLGVDHIKLVQEEIH